MREPTKEERDSVRNYVRSISKSCKPIEEINKDLDAVHHYLETMRDPPEFTEEELKRYCNRLAEVSIPSHFTITWLPVNGEEYHVFKCSNCGKYQTYKSNYCEDCGGAYLGEKD